MKNALRKTYKNGTIFNRLLYNIRMYWFIYLLVLPGFIHTIIFRVFPLYGITVAFKDYKMGKGIGGSPWVGLKHFSVLFQDPYFYKVVWNTVLLNILIIAFTTVITVLLALMLNEIRQRFLKSALQTFVYFPNFVSWVIYAGIITALLSPSSGAINAIIKSFGLEPIYFLASNQYFRFVLVSSSVLKNAGFGTIIYLAAIAGINPEIYESASIDGAHRGHMIWYITLPRILPTISVMVILAASNIFGSNFEQVYNFLNPLVMDTGDVLSTYLYRSGILEGKFEMATVLGLVFSLVGFSIIVLSNKIVNKLDVTGFF